MATHAISARAYRNAELEGGQVCVCRWCESQPRRATKCGKDLRQASSSGGGGGGAYCEEQRWDWGAALHMDHGQHAGKVAFSGSSKEQPGEEKSRSAWDSLGPTKPRLSHSCPPLDPTLAPSASQDLPLCAHFPAH